MSARLVGLGPLAVLAALIAPEQLEARYGGGSAFELSDPEAYLDESLREREELCAPPACASSTALSAFSTRMHDPSSGLTPFSAQNLTRS